jgi:glycosyltransferase involved in cell wall biosynthesis
MPRLGIDLTAAWGPRDGLATVAQRLSQAIVAGGAFSCVVFGPRQGGPDLGGECELVSSPYRRERFNKLLWLPVAEARHGLDAMLYPHWPSPPLRTRGAPRAVVFLHDLAFRLRAREVPWQTRAYLRVLVPRALRQAAAILVPSETTRRDLLEAYPQPGLDGRLRVVHEGVVPLPAGGELPAGLEPGFILAVGSVEPRKNYRRLAAAYSRLREACPGAPKLVLAGRVDLDRDGTVAELRRQQGVELLGHVSDHTLGALYRGAALLAFPSLYEGFGLPLLEAMSVGLPALVSSRGSLPEVAAGAALEVDPDDTEAIAAGLERLLSDSELRRRLALAGPERAATFSWERSARAAVDAIRELALGRSA